MKEETQKAISMPTEVEIDDALGRETEKRQKEQLEKEIKTFTEGIKTMESNIEDFKTQFEIDKRIQDLQLENYHKDKEGRWEFEKLDEYWALHKKKHEYSIRMNRFMGDAKLKQMDAEMDAIREQLKSSQDALNKINEKEENKNDG